MIKQKFNIQNLETLKNMTSCNLKRIEYTTPIFGNVKLEFEEKTVVIFNNMHESNFMNETEEITYFTIEEGSEYQFVLDNIQINNISVNEKVLSIKIVNDLVNYNNEYELSYDVAIIFVTNKHEYIISRDWFFMETMEISIDKNIDDIIPIDNEIETYKCGNDNVNVSIKRNINSI